MSNPYRDKLLSIGVIGNRSRDRVVEGKHHPETDRPFKAVTNEAGTTIEHADNDRVDAIVRPATLRVVR